jgi:hypothetical protein
VIFAELEYPGHYADVHRELESFLPERFTRVESGLQGDSYFWVFDGGEKVAIDTFTSMKHQVKSNSPGPHVLNVIRILELKYQVKAFDPPELEGHEDA